MLSKDMTNDEYHGHKGSYSSSNLKLALEDMELFYKECVLKEKEQQERVAAFDTGTYFHTRVLEPHLLETECAVYKGVRRGKAWDEFEAANKNKAIVSEKNKDVAENLAKLVFESPCAMDLVNRGVPEISAFVDVTVDWENKEIYSSDLKYVLKEDGWVEIPDGQEIQLEMSAIDLVLKVRADSLIEEDGAVLDLKSTTGNAKNNFAVRKKISMYEYDLSASMYLDIFSLAYGKTFDKFYWTFASKDKHNCKTYLASKNNVRVGRAKWAKAVLNIAEYECMGWEFHDSIDELEPEAYQVTEWIRSYK